MNRIESNAKLSLFPLGICELRSGHEWQVPPSQHGSSARRAVAKLYTTSELYPEPGGVIRLSSEKLHVIVLSVLLENRRLIFS
jgi:hypothetical protein